MSNSMMFEEAKLELQRSVSAGDLTAIDKVLN
jgi:hypothetical protein